MENPMKFNILTRARQLFIEKYISSEKDKKILDIGCGIGYFTHLLSENERVYGLDIEKESIRTARKTYDIPFFIADSLSMPFKDKIFDFILVTEVMEHVTDDKKLLDEINRILKGGAKIILTTECSEGVFSPTEICHKGGTKYWIDQKHGGYNTKELKHMFELNGFKVKNISYSLTFFSSILMEISKRVFRKLNPEFRKQSDIYGIERSFFFRFFKKLFFIPMFFIYVDILLSKLLKGSCIIIYAEKV